MKATVKEIAEIYSLLDKSKYSKMESGDRRQLIKAMRPMRMVALEFEDFRYDAANRLKPDNADEIVRVIGEFNAMKPEERASALSEPRFAEALRRNAEFNNELNECLNEELAREVDLDIARLTEEAFDRLMDSNPGWSMGQAMVAERILCGGDSAS